METAAFNFRSVWNLMMWTEFSLEALFFRLLLDASALYLRTIESGKGVVK